MRKFRYSFLVRAEIARVWKFYTDIGHLKVITPPEVHVQIERSTHQQLVEGSEVWLSGILVLRSKWHSKITFLRPYEYVDEMISGRFKFWKHIHKFEKKDDLSTEVTDEIDFELRYGILGKLLEGYVIRRLEQAFRYRQQATMGALEKD